MRRAWEKIKAKQGKEEAAKRGTSGRAAHKNGARSTNKPSGGKMAR